MDLQQRVKRATEALINEPGFVNCAIHTNDPPAICLSFNSVEFAEMYLLKIESQSASAKISRMQGNDSKLIQTFS